MKNNNNPQYFGFLSRHFPENLLRTLNVLPINDVTFLAVGQ